MSSGTGVLLLGTGCAENALLLRYNDETRESCEYCLLLSLVFF
jgi:hypothetical protein